MINNLVVCKVCRQQVANSAKICPHCGNRLKMSLGLKIVIGILIVTIGPTVLSGFFEGVRRPLAGNNTTSFNRESLKSQIVTSSSPTNQAITDIRPEEQKQFESVITTFSEQFNKAQNELQESSYRKDRMNAIKELKINTQITDWTGTLSQLKTNTEGKAYITIRLNNTLSIGTWNNGLSDIGDNTLITMDSELYQTLLNMKTGQKVKFSGSFIQSDIDYFREQSLTIRGSMKTPEFLMRFSSVEGIN